MKNALLRRRRQKNGPASAPSRGAAAPKFQMTLFPEPPRLSLMLVNRALILACPECGVIAERGEKMGGEKAAVRLPCPHCAI